MPIATNQGSVTAARSTSPRRHSSRFQQAVGPPHHHEARPEAASKAAGTGPLVKIPRASSSQKTAATRRDGRWLSSQRQNCPPTNQKRERRVGRRQLRLDQHDRRRRQHQRGEPPDLGTEHPPPQPPDQQAGPRPGAARDQPQAERIVAADRHPEPHQPVDQDRLVIPGLGVVSRKDPVVPRAHLADADRVPRLVAVPETDPLIAREVQHQREDADQERFPEPAPVPEDNAVSRRGNGRLTGRWHGSLRVGWPESLLLCSPIGPGARRSWGPRSNEREAGV